MRVETGRILGELAVEIDPDTPVRGLGVADRQLLEIAKALSSSARLLIMDEPTAALSPNEVDNLFTTVRRLRDRGVAVLFISHRLEEIGELADVVTVIRDGRHIETRPANELSHAELIRLMVGRSLDQLFPKEEVEVGDVVFRAESLLAAGCSRTSRSSFAAARSSASPASSARAGQRSRVRSSASTALTTAGSGSMAARSSRGRRGRRSAAASRICRKTGSTRAWCSRCRSLKNATMAVLPDLTPGGFLRPRRELALTRRFMERLRIKANSPAQVVRSLSGGNQQKVVLSKWLAAEPRILILDEPTHGVDVGTKADVHRTISHLAAQGLTILMISSELPEILGMSDRVLVMREGRLVAELSRDEATQEPIIAAAAGIVAA